MTKDNLIVVGHVAAAHGIRGQVKIKSHTEPEKAIASYPLSDAEGKAFSVRVTGQAKGMLIATVEGIVDRNQAEDLKGTEFYTSRDNLPAPDENEFYYEDLKGLEVRNADGKAFGDVVGVDNYGAGDVIEIKLRNSGKLQMFPFKDKTVPEVNVEGGYIVMVSEE